MDSEGINNSDKKKIKKNKKCDSDFLSIIADLLKKSNIKIAFFLFIVGVFIFSNVFVENILPIIYTDGGSATSYGTLIQLLVFVLCYIVIDLLVAGSLL